MYFPSPRSVTWWLESEVRAFKDQVIAPKQTPYLFLK